MVTKSTPVDLHPPASPGVGVSSLFPFAVNAAGAAQLAGVSRSQWWKLYSAGKVPAPVYLGSKAPRWRVDELREWLAAGAPDLVTWQRRQEAKHARES
jgi:predicted DNA-binding transcriptional regulator AlpA